MEQLADVFTLACTVLDAYSNGSLFEAYILNHDAALLRIDSASGCLPDPWQK